MRTAIRLTGFIALATMAFAATTQDAFTLRLKLEEGKKLTYTQTVVLNQKVDTSAMGSPAQEMEITQSSTMTYTFGKVDPESKKADLTIEMEDLKVDAGGMAGMMMGNDMPTEFTIKATINDRNQISDLKLEGMPAMMMMFTGGEEGMEATMNLFIFPEQAVRVGDSWDMKLPKSPLYGGAEPTMKVTLKETKEVKGRKALVFTVTGEVPMRVDIGELMRNAPDAGPMGGMNMLMTGTLKTDSTMTVDATTGHMISLESTADSNLEMEMVDMGVKMPITGTTKTVIRLKE